jgi:nitrogen fixation protein FixH
LRQDTKKKFEVWPVGLFLSFLVFFVIQGIMVYQAGHGFEGPDDVKYYKMGLEYSKEIQRQKVQRDLGWTVETDLSKMPQLQSNAQAQVECKDRQGNPIEGELEARFSRPVTTKDDLFQSVKLTDGKAKLNLPSQDGVWDMTVWVRSNGNEHHEKRRFHKVAGG